MTTLMAWNILHGGGRRRIPEIVLTLLDGAGDVIIINEYRSHVGGQLRGVLGEHGWEHQVCSDPPRGCNGVLIASKIPLDRPSPDSDRPGCLLQRWVRVRVLNGDRAFTLIGVHLPEDQRPGDKLCAWSYLLGVARDEAGRDTIILGDLNTGRHLQDEAGSTFACSTQMGHLWTMGYRDAWREKHPAEREVSWVSHTGGGFRIDHALCSGSIYPRVREAKYLHGVRQQGLSDHSALVVSLADPVVRREKSEKSVLFG